jgi:hypothetical protein
MVGWLVVILLLYPTVLCIYTVPVHKFDDMLYDTGAGSETFFGHNVSGWIMEL